MRLLVIMPSSSEPVTFFTSPITIMVSGLFMPYARISPPLLRAIFELFESVSEPDSRLYFTFTFYNSLVAISPFWVWSFEPSEVADAADIAFLLDITGFNRLITPVDAAVCWSRHWLSARISPFDYWYYRLPSMDGHHFARFRRSFRRSLQCRSFFSLRRWSRLAGRDL